MTFRRLLDDLEGHTLEKAVPRGPDHALLDVRTPSGARVAGQWFGDADRAAHVTRATARALTTPAGVRRLGGRVVLQPGGADRRLTPLAALAARPGADLVAHRPERRGVVRHETDGAAAFTKVVRPGRVAALAGTLAAVAAAGVRAPRVVATGESTLTTAALPGDTLHEALAGPGADPGALHEVGRAVGTAVRRLHSVGVPAGNAATAHDGAAEIAVTRRWLGLAEAYGVLGVPRGVVEAGLARAETALVPCARPVLLHRDLHDKQLLVDSAEVGMLDLDLLAVGDPALDLANLLVHLELRARQGHTTAELAAACADGVLAGYRPTAVERTTLRGYALATRLRLLAVYAFRPTSTHAARRVLTDPWEMT